MAMLIPDGKFKTKKKKKHNTTTTRDKEKTFPNDYQSIKKI